MLTFTWGSRYMLILLCLELFPTGISVSMRQPRTKLGSLVAAEEYWGKDILGGGAARMGDRHVE